MSRLEDLAFLYSCRRVLETTVLFQIKLLKSTYRDSTDSLRAHTRLALKHLNDRETSGQAHPLLVVNRDGVEDLGPEGRVAARGEGIAVDHVVAHEAHVHVGEGGPVGVAVGVASVSAEAWHVDPLGEGVAAPNGFAGGLDIDRDLGQEDVEVGKDLEGEEPALGDIIAFEGDLLDWVDLGGDRGAHGVDGELGCVGLAGCVLVSYSSLIIKRERECSDVFSVRSETLTSMLTKYFSFLNLLTTEKPATSYSPPRSNWIQSILFVDV